ncbi:peroxidase family protein [Xylogone sp. PMI_703]|nr:peroxidase family protein [Xylogone sp. PMI_703]
MPLISLPEGAPGMIALRGYRPDVYQRLASLADLMLQNISPGSTITPGERELIASYVSSLNHCNYCRLSHGAVSAAHLQDRAVVDDVQQYATSSKVSAKVKALLEIAAVVQRSGSPDVSSEAVEAAKSHGATEMDVHDTVFIAAMFCMFNRYVDGLKTEMPGDVEAFIGRGRVIAENGYGQAPPASGGTGR